MGKGSKRRQEDFNKVQSNWDSIDWKSDSRANPKISSETIQSSVRAAKKRLSNYTKEQKKDLLDKAKKIRYDALCRNLL